MANINKELNEIKNSVYGKEVRGSIHDGIKKINEESEESKLKANEAHDVMESIMQEGFDNAALESNFEQKLDDKIANLQPEWTQFKEATNAQLADTDQQRFFESMINRKGKSRGMISIVDDDGDKGFYTKLRPLALEYGIVFTSALVTGVARGFPGDERTQSGKYMDYDDIMTMHEEGTAEFIGHSHTHPNLRELSLSELREEFTNSQDFLRRYGLNHRGMVFPFNRVNQQVMDTVREYFDYSLGNAPHGVVEPPFDNYYIPRNVIRFGQNISDLKLLIDEAAAQEKWIILYTHIDQDGYVESDMRELIEHALSKNLEFVTTKKGVRHHGNIAQLQTPKYTDFAPDNIKDIDIITARGELYGKNLGTVRIARFGEYINNAPVTDFPQNKIVRVKVRNVDASDYNLPSAGFVDVYRNGEIQYSYRKFTPTHQEADVLYSRWDNVSKSWRDWESVGGGMILDKSFGWYDINAPVTDFPARKIVRVKVRAQDASDYDLPGAGLIDVYRDGEIQYSYREYKRYKVPERKISYWDQNNNVWGAWQDF